MTLFWAGIGAVFAGGAAQFFLPGRHKAACVCLFTGIGASMLAILSADVIINGPVPLSAVGPAAGPVFSMDVLSAFFTLIIAVMGFIGTIYAAGYMKMFESRKTGLASHFFFLPVLLISMAMVVVSQTVISFLISWELMSLSSFFLVIFESDRPEAFEAGIYYLVLMHICVVFLVAGFALASVRTGSFYFSGFSAPLKADKGLSDIVFMLLLAGFGIKAGFIPMHTWLPAAHPAALSHVSGIMSGIMIKLGIYGILRALMFTHAPGAGLSYAVLTAGAVSSLLGVLYAVAQHDMKRLLAYHSVENIGIIGMGIGLGMLGISYGNPYMAFLGFAGAVLHALNHSIFKELLFYGAGAVYSKAHTRDIESLGGLIKKMPYTAFYFLTGSTAISGIPPLNGFVSEFIIFMAMLAGIKMKLPLLTAAGVAAMAALAFTGAMALLCFTKIFSVVFLGTPRSKKAAVEPGEDRAMLCAMAILSVFCGLIGFFPQYAILLAAKPAAQVLLSFGIDMPDLSQLSSILTKMSVIFMSAAGAGVIIYIIRKAVMRSRTSRQNTWGCGYAAPNSRMQYTASSYASPFLKLSGVFLIKRDRAEEPAGLFPEKASFRTHSKDIFEEYFIKPASAATEKFLKLFSWIQSGNMQQYILYGLVFLVASIVWVICVK